MSLAVDVRASSYFMPTLKQAPADAVIASHQLLVRAGFIRQLGAGLYTYLPLGQRTLAKIERILREEMQRAGALEFVPPALHPAELWRASGRWDAIDDTMFRLKDRRASDYCLAMTHEEVFASLARSDLHSYRQLPQRWFQIGPKFRDEPRPRGGLLRAREFLMKDAYSFDLDAAGLDASFAAMRAAYTRIYARCALVALQAEADSGAMGGRESIEFVVRTASGEDIVIHCAQCGYAANREVLVPLRTDAASPSVKAAPPSDREEAACQGCGGPLEAFQALEVGHIFKQGTRYSDPLGATVLGPEGTEVALMMGAYGIGLGRLMAAIVDAHHDAEGIIWPASVAPFDVTVLTLGSEPELSRLAEQAVRELEQAGLEVLLDDRDERAGVKFNDADLIGIPWRIGVGQRALQANAVEVKHRASRDVQLMKLDELRQLSSASSSTGASPLIELTDGKSNAAAKR